MRTHQAPRIEDDVQVTVWSQSTVLKAFVLYCGQKEKCLLGPWNFFAAVHRVATGNNRCTAILPVSAGSSSYSTSMGHTHTPVLTLNVLGSNTADFQWRNLIHITILLLSLRDLGSTQCQCDSVHV